MSQAFSTLPPLVDALGWTLIHFVWQGALFGLLFAALMTTMVNSSASARHAMAVAVLVLLGLAPIATFCVLAMGDSAAAKLLATPVAVTGWWISVGGSLKSLLPWAVVAWMVGVAGLSGRLALDWMAVRRLGSYGTKPLSPEMDKLAERVRQAYRVGLEVRVLQSAIVNVPLAVGWLKPIILIPPSVLMGLTPRQLELILAHEFAHICRYDHLINLYQVILETLLFYHPVVRWVSNRVRVERENCCDDLVVARTGDSVAYARALTELEGLRNASPQLALAATDGQLLHRVNRLVAKRDPQRGSVAWAVGLLLVLINLSVFTGTQIALDGVEDAGRLLAEPVLTQRAEAKPSSTVLVEAANGPMFLLAAKAIPDPVSPDKLFEPLPPVEPLAREPRKAFESTQDAGDVQAQQTTTTGVHEPILVDAKRDTRAEAGETKEAAQIAGETESLLLADVLHDVLRGQTPVSQDVALSGPVYTGGELVKGKPPSFPRKAKRLPSGGWVVVRFTVDLTGRVDELAVVESRPVGVFDQAVKRAVSKWRFQPYELDGKAVARTITQGFEFEPDLSRVVDASAEKACKVVTGSRLCRTRFAEPWERGVEVIYQARR